MNANNYFNIRTYVSTPQILNNANLFIIKMMTALAMFTQVFISQNLCETETLPQTQTMHAFIGFLLKSCLFMCNTFQHKPIDIHTSSVTTGLLVFKGNPFCIYVSF